MLKNLSNTWKYIGNIKNIQETQGNSQEKEFQNRRKCLEISRKYVKRLREHLGNTWEIRTQTYLGNIRKYLCPLGNTQIDLENNWKYLGNTEIRQRFPSLFFAKTACQTVSKCLKWIERFWQFFRLAKPNGAH